MRKLKDIAENLDRQANINRRELFIEFDSNGKNPDFCVAINDENTLGAFGNCIEDDKEKILFFILDKNLVKYCFDEGWELDDLYKVMGQKLFLEVTEDNFFEIMTEKKSVD